MTRRDPPQLTLSLKESKRGDCRALLEAFGELEFEAPGLGWFALWRTAEERESPEFLRTLSFAIAKSTERSAPREAARLWACSATDREDLSTILNLLSGVESEVRSESRIPLPASVLLGFLRRCLDHPEEVVRHSALDLVEAICDEGIVGSFVNRAAGEDLANRIESTVAESADEEEAETVRFVVGALRAEAVPVLPPSSSRSLRRLVLDLEDVVEQITDRISGTEKLVDAVRRQALLAESVAESVRMAAPVQTVRLENAAPRVRLVEAFLSFGEEVVREFREPDPDALQSLDFGVRVRAAQAASFPVHITYTGDDATRVFAALSALLEFSTKPELQDDLLTNISPAIATAGLRLLQHAGEGGLVEVVLSDPRLADWQKTIVASLSTKDLSRVRNRLAEAVRASIRTKVWLKSSHVPQANTVTLVFQAVDAMLSRGEVRVTDLEGVSSARQVNYYRQGARVLGLLDDDNLPTRRARTLEGLGAEQRLALAAVFFEDSPIGRAWMQWYGDARRLIDVPVATAREFLAESVVGLGGSTVPRRASTLAKWYEELMPYHYAAQPRPVAP